MANDGQQAVDMVNAGLDDGITYCLIFMDLSMPIMDGFEATEAIRDLYEGSTQPKILAVTGHCEPQFISKAWRHDFDEIMPKPVDA